MNVDFFDFFDGVENMDVVDLLDISNSNNVLTANGRNLLDLLDNLIGPHVYVRYNEILVGENVERIRTFAVWTNRLGDYLAKVDVDRGNLVYATPEVLVDLAAHRVV